MVKFNPIFVLTICCSAFFVTHAGNLEANLNTTGIIKYYGYPVETHEVTTADGYILTMYRIPYGIKFSTEKRNKRIKRYKRRDHYKERKDDEGEDRHQHRRPVVFLQHGLTDASRTWVINPPNESLAFILADNGFDVWLGNSRGNGESYKHKLLSNVSNAYWDFTWDDMAKYDLDASINYALRVSRSYKLGYVGHSQGGAIAFAKLGQESDLNDQISAYVALAPAVYLGHMKDSRKYLAYIDNSILYNILGLGIYEPTNKQMQEFMGRLCGYQAALDVCKSMLANPSKLVTTMLNASRMDVYASHGPFPTSVRNALHYPQAYKSKQFQMFDYGTEINLKRYGRATPPTYEVNTHGVPTAVFYGGQDSLTVTEDVKQLIDELGDDVKFSKFLDSYSHMDFVWGINAATDVYVDTVDFLKKYQ